jgi:hypothetical protein
LKDEIAVSSLAAIKINPQVVRAFVSVTVTEDPSPTEMNRNGLPTLVGATTSEVRACPLHQK